MESVCPGCHLVVAPFAPGRKIVGKFVFHSEHCVLKHLHRKPNVKPRTVRERFKLRRLA